MSGILTRLRNGVRRRWYAPDIKVHNIPGLIRLGSHDCGLTVQPSADLTEATVITAGFGEDASFDIEFARRFGAKIIAVDPTPRSVCYFELLQARFGQENSRDYVVHGAQPIEAYDLRGLAEGDIILEQSALWCENAMLKFFAPPNPDYVSHSITNIQNNYSHETPHILVQAITPEDLLKKYGLKSVPLMKFDIEGAEAQVIPHMLRRNILPRQMLVEYDEMIYPSSRSKATTEATHAALTAAGYLVRHASGDGNFLYIRD